MGKISEDDKNKVRNFTTAVLPELDKIREHIIQCGLDDKKIISIVISGNGYLHMDFQEISGASVYRIRTGNDTTVSFEETENVPV